VSEALVKTWHGAAGGRRDCIFTNACIGVTGETEEIPLASWRRIIDIHLHGVLNGVLAAYPIMLKQGSGHFVSTASLAGLGPVPVMAPYWPDPRMRWINAPKKRSRRSTKIRA
jgi:NADP-dependent 3-hydroxy acid dehydrogenase YdfG